jgi:hypothetical protein
MAPYGGRDVPANVSCEEVTLDTSLGPGKSTILETYSALAHQLKPRPREILQGENQRVLLTAAQHTISPYPISSETTEVPSCLPQTLHLLPCIIILSRYISRILHPSLESLRVIGLEVI